MSRDSQSDSSVRAHENLRMLFPTQQGQPAWFALTVKPRHEKTASAALRLRGLEEFLPLYRSRRRWSDRSKELELALFPGYVFCRIPYERRLEVLNVPSVRGIVGFGSSPSAVPEEEIRSIRFILASGLHVWPWPYIQPGQRVRVESGPLAGLTGTLVREKDAWRVVVNVELLRRSVAVEMDRETVARVHRNSSSEHSLAAAARFLYGHSPA